MTAFDDWYEARRDEARRYSRTSKRTIVVATLMMVASVPFLALIFSGGPVANGTTVAFVVFFVVQASLCLSVIAYSAYKYVTRNSWVDQLATIAPARLANTALGDLVFDTFAKFGVDVGSVRFVLGSLATRSLPAPSITDARGGAVLVLPVSLFGLARTNSLLARGLIAHEVAHLAHNDEQLWSLTTFCKTYHAFFLWIIGLNFLPLAAAWVMGHAPKLPFALALVVVGNYHLDSVFRARRMSETLADLGAARVVGFEAITKAVEALADDGISSETVLNLNPADREPTSDLSVDRMHPCKAFRLLQLNRWKQKALTSCISG
jgi:hypothetical protein